MILPTTTLVTAIMANKNTEMAAAYPISYRTVPTSDRWETMVSTELSALG